MHERLAAGPVAEVQRCLECGAVSVHLGAVTLRLTESAVDSLWSTLGDALVSMRAGSGPSLFTPAPLDRGRA